MGVGNVKGERTSQPSPRRKLTAAKIEPFAHIGVQTPCAMFLDFAPAQRGGRARPDAYERTPGHHCSFGVPEERAILDLHGDDDQGRVIS